MKKCLVPLPVAWAVCIFTALAHAGLAPENVAVVVNADSWSSLTIANEFVSLHGIPASNVVYLSGFDDLEHMTVEAFRTEVLKAVFETLGRRGLGQQIDCIAYSSDIPYIVDISADVPPEMRSSATGSHGSITGLTYLYPLVFGAKGHYAALMTNFYHRRLITPVQEGGLSPREIGDFQRVRKLMSDSQWEEALEALAALAQRRPRASAIQYETAICLARLNRHDEALDALKRAVDYGLLNWREMARQEAFKPIRDRVEFQNLLKEVADRRCDVSPPVPFRATRAWDPQGNAVELGKGMQYMLSTMLGVTTGRGNSITEVLEALRRSAAADGQRPQGTFYLMRNDDIRSLARDWLFESVADRLARDGFRAQIVEGKIPLKRDDVLGVVTGTAAFDWAPSGSTIVPGAICEHFTSYGGRLTEQAGQTPISAWIRSGASGTSGTVVEPLALHPKFPSPFLHVHYALGCSLAEAFYLSVAAPYQLLIIGDPLCAPWAKRPRLELNGIDEGSILRGRVEFSARVADVPASAVAVFETYVDGVRTCLTQPPQQPIVLDTATLPDGWHDLTVVAVMADGIETRVRAGASVRVANANYTLRAKIAGPEAVPINVPIRVEAALPGAASIQIMHNSRVLGTIEGESGTATIDLRAVGCGQARLRCIGVLADERQTRVFGPPLQITVVPPDRLQPAKTTSEPTSAGFVVIRPGQQPAIVTEARSSTWLKDSGVAPGDEFTLQGIYEAPEDEICQVQVLTDGRAKILMDGQLLLEDPRIGKWLCVAVPLTRGPHRLEVHGTAGPSALFSLRIGSRGARSIGSSVLRQPPQAVSGVKEEGPKAP